MQTGGVGQPQPLPSPGYARRGSTVQAKGLDSIRSIQARWAQTTNRFFQASSGQVVCLTKEPLVLCKRSTGVAHGDARSPSFAAHIEKVRGEATEGESQEYVFGSELLEQHHDELLRGLRSGNASFCAIYT